MRVISGTAKGHKLTAPKSPLVRPALDKIKGAVFNILFDVTGVRVLDLFAGTGSMGIEALSRGAESAVFVENFMPSIESLKKNLSHTKLEHLATIVKMDSLKAIDFLSKREGTFDLIFVDPPYEKGFVSKTLQKLGESKLVHPGTIIVVEHHPKEPILPMETLVLTDSRKYGQTLISFLKPRGAL